MSDAVVASPLWVPTPEYIRRHQLSAFVAHLKALYGLDFRTDYGTLHRWTLTQRADFWSAVVSFTGIVHEGSLMPAILDPDALPGAQWFPQARLNFAENLLRHPAEETAVIAIDESGSRDVYTFDRLNADVARYQRAMRAGGVGSTDVVAAILPNRYEAIVGMLACASLGAAWCSVSPDFGAAGILDRFAQLRPRLLLAARRYRYAGRDFDITDKLRTVMAGLPDLTQCVIVDGDPGPLSATPIETYLRSSNDHGDPEIRLRPTFERFPFSHLLYVLFTSGTTGVPKAIQHGAGGTLLQLLKEHVLHCDVRAGDRMFFPTTLGWMMWNWLVNGLAAGSAIILYDGSFSFPTNTRLFDILVRERVTLAGLSGAFLEASRKADLDLTQTHDPSTVRLVFAGGSVLSPEAHRYAAEKLMPGKPIASCSGGTDIVSCFLITNPWGPIWPGELQAAGLGMDMAVYDSNGRPVEEQKGELVCRAPAPSMPLGFANDPDGSRYRAAYFERFPGVWSHGDMVATTEHGGYIIYGRSDTVLNPGGVRIGTAEIYRQVDTVAGVLASVAVGKEVEADVEVALFVKLAPGLELTEELVRTLRTTIREGASPRHVPKHIAAVKDIPLTRSGKIAEVAVREVVNGRPVKNTEALANPEALKFFAS